jgi:hypothetical protein
MAVSPAIIDLCMLSVSNTVALAGATAAWPTFRIVAVPFTAPQA